MMKKSETIYFLGGPTYTQTRAQWADRKSSAHTQTDNTPARAQTAIDAAPKLRVL